LASVPRWLPSDPGVCWSCQVGASHASLDLPSDAGLGRVTLFDVLHAKDPHILGHCSVSGDGTPGQSACHTGKNFIMTYASDRADPHAPLKLNVLRGTGRLPPRCDPPTGVPRASDYGRRSLRSCEMKPSTEVTGSVA
jgi:hypothetical protein